MGNINEVSKKIKTISILGDSYSSFIGWIDGSYECWYPPKKELEKNNVREVTQTWWYQLCDESGIKLVKNESYSGSTICNTGYEGVDSTKSSYITRAEKSFGKTSKILEKADVLIVFGGTNDEWAGSPVGDVKYSNWDNEDKKKMIPAFCYILNCLKVNNEKSKIITIINDEIRVASQEKMIEACEHYDIKSLRLKEIDKVEGHPTILGMKQIKEQILEFLIEEV